MEKKMRQSTLGKWMNLPERKSTSHKTLVLDWSSRKVSFGAASECQLVGSVKLPGGTMEIGYVASGDEGAFLGVDSTFRSVPIMKSHLQKAVRRMAVDAALGATRELIGMDLASLLRRIPIIAIEDVAPVQGMEVCIWMMIAHSKGFVLSKSHLEYLAGFVKSITEYPRKVRNYKELPDEDKIAPNLTEDTKVLIECLALRRSYGGMKGDMRMIRILEDHLKKGKQEILGMDVAEVSVESITILDRGESWVPAAIDFHVSGIARKLADSKKVDEARIRRLMWCNSSSLNYRQKPKPIAKEWTGMEEQYIILAKWWIKNQA